MRRSHNSVVRPCAFGARGSLASAQLPTAPQFSRAFIETLSNLAKVREQVEQDAAAVARELEDWIGSDD